MCACLVQANWSFQIALSAWKGLTMMSQELSPRCAQLYPPSGLVKLSLHCNELQLAKSLVALAA